MPAKSNAQKNPSSIFVIFFAFIFVLSLAGFSVKFIDFVKVQKRVAYSLKHGSNVAGVSKKIITLEIRSPYKVIADEVAAALDSNPNYRVIDTNETSLSYDRNILVDLSDGSKVILVSDLENSISAGSQKNLPKGEKETDAEVLIIVSK